jgi:putative peptidoglycan lipid II flippase
MRTFRYGAGLLVNLKSWIDCSNWVLIPSVLNQLRRFANQGSVNSRIARAAVLSGGLTAGVKVASLAREILVAAVFGVSGQIDAYLIALMLVGIPHGIVLYAVQWTLIPEFVRTDSIYGHATSRRLLRQVVAITLLILTVVLVLWALLLPNLIAYLTRAGQGSASAAVRNCVLVLGAFYFASGTVLLGYGALQARKRFLINGTVPLATPLVMVAVLLAFPFARAETLAIGMALGAVLELVIIEAVLRRDGLTMLPASPFKGPLGQPFMISLAKVAGGAAAIALLPLVEQTAAVEFGVGAVATLGYGNRLPALLNGLAISAFAIAVLPYFSEMLARGEATQCRRTLERYALVLGAGGAAVAFVLILGSDGIVRVVFQRGAFDEIASVGVALAQQAYLMQIPGALVLTLASRLLLAQGEVAAVGVLYLGQLLLFVVGAFVGIRLGDKAAVIALAYSLAVTLAAAGGYLLALRSFNHDR